MVCSPAHACFAPPSRCIVLTDTPSLLRGRLVTPGLPSWPPKDPIERKTYAADFGALLPAGAVVAQVDVDIEPSGSLVLWSVQNVGGLVSVDLGGGTAGSSATVTVVVTVATGDRLVRGIVLPIVALGILGTPGDVLIVNGFPLTFGGVSIAVGNT